MTNSKHTQKSRDRRAGERRTEKRRAHRRFGPQNGADPDRRQNERRDTAEKS